MGKSDTLKAGGGKEGETDELPFGLKGLTPEMLQHCGAAFISGEEHEDFSKGEGQGEEAEEKSEAPLDSDVEYDDLPEEAAISNVDEALTAPPDEQPAGAPPGARVGIVGFSQAENRRARCYICLSAGLSDSQAVVNTGEDRFWFRKSRTAPDRSIHARCVLSGAFRTCPAIKEQRLTDSARYLVNAAMEAGLPPERRTLFLDAYDAVRADAGASSGHNGPAAAASGSGGAAGSGTAAGSGGV